MKKYTTLIMLVAVIISAFAITTVAVENEIIGDNVYLVDIQTMRVTGVAPQTETATFNTISDTINHGDWVALGCMECPESVVHWTSASSDVPGYDPTAAVVSKEFAWSCWKQHKGDHGHVYYDINIYN